MKRFILLLLPLAMTIGNSVFAQEQESSERRQKQMQVEKKIENFIQENLESVDVTAYEEQFQRRLDNASPEIREELKSVPYQQRILNYKKRFLRKEYFEQYLTTKDGSVVPLFDPVPAPICAGGDFENGQIGSMYVGYADTYNSGECSTIPAGSTASFFSTPFLLNNPNSQNFKITNLTTDPIIGNALDPTNGSNHALRINSRLPCTPGKGINKLVKAIILPSSGTQTITFQYAFVAENPAGHNNAQPFFTARAVDPNYQNEFDRICIISNQNDPFLNVLNNPNPNGCLDKTVVWRNWTCASLEVSGQQGDVVYLEFIVGDCGAGAHFGYAYIDDICIQVCPDQDMGSIDLNETNPCEDDRGIYVSGCFTPPVVQGETAHLLYLELVILDANGNSVNTLYHSPQPFPSPILDPIVRDNCFYWPLDTTAFPLPSGGYDFKITAFFAFNNNPGIVALTDQQTNPGLGNDYIFNYNPSANFTGSINNNGVIQITGFNSYPNVSNEWYVVSSPNQNGGPYTPVTSTVNDNNLGFVLYNNAQSGIYYTVIHKINTLCGSRCVAYVYYYNEGLQKPFLQEESTDCCLAFEFWPNGPGTPSDFTGEFNIGFNANGTIYTANEQTYSNNPNVVNTWTLYSSVNQSGGPYVLVDTDSGLTYSYLNAQDNLYYFLIHTVESNCGKVCYLQSISRNPARGTNNSPLGEVSCDIFEEDLCKAPENIEVNCGRGGLYILWDATPNSGGYIVEIVYNGMVSYIRQYNVSTNSLMTIFNYPFTSYSVKIGTICGDNIFWSDLISSSCEEAMTINPRQRNINISPNPTNGIVQFSFQSKGPKLKSITLLNVVGVKKAEIPVQPYEGNEIVFPWNTQELGEPGIYFVHFRTDQGEDIVKKLIVE